VPTALKESEMNRAYGNDTYRIVAALESIEDILSSLSNALEKRLSALENAHKASECPTTSQDGIPVGSQWVSIAGERLIVSHTHGDIIYYQWPGSYVEYHEHTSDFLDLFTRVQEDPEVGSTWHWKSYSQDPFTITSSKDDKVEYRYINTTSTHYMYLKEWRDYIKYKDIIALQGP
jgi:hypothetical protein